MVQHKQYIHNKRTQCCIETEAYPVVFVAKQKFLVSAFEQKKLFCCPERVIATLHVIAHRTMCVFHYDKRCSKGRPTVHDDDFA